MLEWAEIKKTRRWMATLYQIYDSMILKPYLDDIILCYHCKIIFFLFGSCLWNLHGVVSAVCFSFMEFTKILQSLFRMTTITIYKLQQKKKVTLFWKLCNFIFLCAKYCLTQCQLHVDTWRCIFLWEWLES